MIKTKKQDNKKQPTTFLNVKSDGQTKQTQDAKLYSNQAYTKPIYKSVRFF